MNQHKHHSHPVPHGRAFAIGIGLNIAFVAIEIIFGIIANSSALLADAGHNASDVLGLAFAWTAAWLATSKPKGKYTYGLRKTTILVSILNALLLFGASAAIGLDAFWKIKDPQPVEGTQVMIVAGIGVIINTLTALLFIKGQKEDLNIRGAFLHMAADAAISLGVVIAGLIISITGFYLIDPIMSFIIIALIIYSTWHLFSDSVNLALDAVPKRINVEEVKKFIENRKGVESVHDLHIWAMSTTQVALTSHLVMPAGNDDDFIRQLTIDLKNEFNIGHSTFQVETTNLESLHSC